MKKAALLLALLSIMMLAALSAKDNSALDSIQISPNPMTKHTEITLVFGQATPLGVTIETASGAVVKTLFSGQSQEFMVLPWDRCGNDGSYTPAGEYYVVVAEGRYTSTKKTLILK
ncbi:MAG: hypothetical protein LHW45_05190 [Candidatus Cloacimonetes bacterium]|nr:hypothetical protein [Candidatus Cloacimonadota bacterium]MDY0367003.1 FlgD immunoglobulin-like domain containing protein [Candidatus Syntrophosphaera sp.]